MRTEQINADQWEKLNGDIAVPFFVDRPPHLALEKSKQRKKEILTRRSCPNVGFILRRNTEKVEIF
jgi:hypothetical protein